MRTFDQPSDFPKSDYRSKNYSGVWQKRFIDDYLDRTSKRGLEQTVKEMANFTREHFPSHLYKFFGSNLYSLVSLENDQLWLNSPRAFNDPFDSYVCVERGTFEKKYILNELQKAGLIRDDGNADTLTNREMWAIRHSYSKEEVDRPGRYYFNRKYYDGVLRDTLSTKSADLRDFIENLEIEARRSFRRTVDTIRNVDVRITCFSDFKDDDELAKNTTMWSHYASNHTGFCVKYSLANADDFVKTSLLPVKYTSNVPKLSIPSILKNLDGSEKLMANLSIAKASRKALITKSAFWNYEKEWRLIVENERVDLLQNNCVSFPYAEAIYMGCRMEANLRYHLASFAKRNNIRIFETRPNEERFVLDIYETSYEKLMEGAWYDEVLATREGSKQELELYRDRLYRRRYGS